MAALRRGAGGPKGMDKTQHRTAYSGIGGGRRWQDGSVSLFPWVVLAVQLRVTEAVPVVHQVDCW